jgi:hypothetical protein
MPAAIATLPSRTHVPLSKAIRVVIMRHTRACMAPAIGWDGFLQSSMRDGNLRVIG